MVNNKVNFDHCRHFVLAHHPQTTGYHCLFPQLAGVNPGLVYIYEYPTNNLIYSNARLMETLGFSNQNMGPMTWTTVTERIHPEDRARTAEHREKLLHNQNGPYCEIEFRIESLDGNWRWLLARELTFRRSASGDSIQILGIALDISTRKAVEDALRTSEAKLRLIEENFDGVFLIVSPGWESVDYVSPAYQKIWARSCESLYSEPESFFQTIPAAERAGIEADIKTGQLRPLEFRIIRPDGHFRWVKFQISTVTNPQINQDQWLGIARDVTEEKAAQETTRRLEQEVLKVGELEQKRIGQDLHDTVCQNLTGISLLCKVLERDLSEQERMEAKDVRKILALLDETTSQTRTLARGLVSVGSESNGLMSALLEHSKHIGQLFKITCHFQCREPVLLNNSFLATHLFRIAQEAVSNAIHHGKASTIIVELKKLAEGKAVLIISDTGVGFDHSNNGTQGLGLSIMQYRAHMIGAQLQIRSKPGSGTTVSCFFEFPSLTHPFDLAVAGRAE